MKVEALLKKMIQPVVLPQDTIIEWIDQWQEKQIFPETVFFKKMVYKIGCAWDSARNTNAYRGNFRQCRDFSIHHDSSSANPGSDTCFRAYIPFSDSLRVSINGMSTK